MSPDIADVPRGQNFPYLRTTSQKPCHSTCGPTIGRSSVSSGSYIVRNAASQSAPASGVRICTVTRSAGNLWAHEDLRSAALKVCLGLGGAAGGQELGSQTWLRTNSCVTLGKLFNLSETQLPLL